MHAALDFLHEWHSHQQLIIITIIVKFTHSLGYRFCLGKKGNIVQKQQYCSSSEQNFFVYCSSQ